MSLRNVKNIPKKSCGSEHILKNEKLEIKSGQGISDLLVEKLFTSPFFFC